MSNQFHVELASSRSEVAKLEKRIRLLEELVALENEHGETDHHIVATATEIADAPKRRGRPPRQTQNQTHSNAHAAAAAKSMTLPSLLISIGSQSSGPLTIAEISQLVDQAGYKSKSEDPGYMIYQSLYKLCKKGVFERDRQEGSYRFIGVEQD